MKLGKIVKKTLKGLGITLVLLIGAAIAIPYFFKDELMAEIKKGINENVNATVNFEDVSLSLFRSFPDFSLRLKGLDVVGVDEFEGLRLAGMKSLDVTLDVMSVIKSERPIEIEKIALNKPNLYVQVLKDGTANYDIAKPSTDTTTVTPETSGEPTEFQINLKSYSINDANVVYDDHSMDVFVDIKDLTHKGKGDFTATVYDLVTSTKADAITIDFGGVKYLNDTKTDMDITLNIDMDASKYTMKENKIKLNALELNFDGFVAMPGDDIAMDVKFNSPGTDFKDLLSMVPAAYTADFKKVKTNGTMSLDGFAKGTYSGDVMPAFALNLKATDGSFKYPDLPMGMSNINTDISINSPESDLDKMIVNVSKFHIDLDKNPFDAKLLLTNPMSDPYIESVVNGKIDLGSLAKAFPLDEQGVKTLSGIIEANLDTKTRMSYVTNEKYEKVQMKGGLVATNVNYEGDGLPTIIVNEFQSKFTPERLELDNFDVKLGESDLKMNGTFDNLLTYFSGEKTMKGDLTVRSNYFNANEWTESSEPTETVNEPTVVIEDTTSAPGSSELPDRFDFVIDVDMKKVDYDIYKITNTVMKGHITPEKMDFAEFSTKVGNSDFKITGVLENALGFAMKGETLKGDVNLFSALIDGDELAGTGTSETTTEAPAPTPAPETTENTTPIENGNEIFGKFDVDINGVIGKIKYDIYDITDVGIDGNISHEEMNFERLKMNIGKSDFAIAGSITSMFDYLFNDGTIGGTLVMMSNFMDADELAGTETTSTPTTTTTAPAAPTNTTPKASKGNEEFGKFDFNVDLIINELKYDVYKISDMELIGHLKHDVMNFEEFTMFLGNSDFSMSGAVQDVIDYMYGDGKVKGQLNLASRFMDVNQFMTTDETATATAKPEQPVATSNETIEPALIPDNVDIIINADLDKLMYAKMNIDNMQGQIMVSESKATMNNVTMNTLGGKVGLNGEYNTQDVEKPLFKFAYDLQKLSFSESFKSLNTVKAIAPIAQFIDGFFNSQLSISGILGKDMMPKFETLDSKGLLETLDAVIKNYKPLSNIGDQLNLKEFKDFQLKNSKNYFEIKDGAVEVKPFDFIVKDIPITGNGSYVITKDIDFKFNMKIPKELLNKNQATAAVNTGVDLLSKQASNFGINIANGSVYDVDVLLTGDATNPKVKVKLVGTSGDAVKNAVEDKITDEVDKVKDKVEDKVNETKEDLEKKAQEELDKAKELAKARADSMKKALEAELQKEKDKVADQIKKEADKVVDKVSDEVKDKIDDKAKEELDKLKDKVGDKVSDQTKKELDKLKDKIKLPFGKKKDKSGGN